MKGKVKYRGWGWGVKRGREADALCSATLGHSFLLVLTLIVKVYVTINNRD